MAKGLVVDLAEWRVEAAQSRRHWADKMWVLGSSGSRYMLGFFPFFSFFFFLSITRTWTMNPACGRPVAQALVVDKSWRRFFLSTLYWFSVIFQLNIFFTLTIYSFYTLLLDPTLYPYILRMYTLFHPQHGRPALFRLNYHHPPLM